MQAQVQRGEAREMQPEDELKRENQLCNTAYSACASVLPTGSKGETSHGRFQAVTVRWPIFTSCLRSSQAVSLQRNTAWQHGLFRRILTFFFPHTKYIGPKRRRSRSTDLKSFFLSFVFLAF